METTMQIIAAVLAVPLAGLGFRALLMPTNMADAVGLTAPEVPGLSEVRSVLGGLLAGSAALIVTGLVSDEPTWFLAVAVLMGVALVGRLVSLVVDGFSAEVIPPIAVEAVIGVAMILTAVAID
ncbi:MAG: DUF4345 family protein [Actinomycetota bacterium]